MDGVERKRLKRLYDKQAKKVMKKNNIICNFKKKKQIRKILPKIADKLVAAFQKGDAAFKYTGKENE